MMNSRMLGWAITTSLVVASLGNTAMASTAFFSFTGPFMNGSETLSFHIDTIATIRPPDNFSSRTWHCFGGINAAGYPVIGGGFDPVLRLLNESHALIALDDDIDRSIFNYDAELAWGSALYVPPEIALPNPLRAGSYRLDMTGYSSGGSHWAVDLVGPSDKMTLTGISMTSGISSTTIDYLVMDTDGTDQTPAKLTLNASQNPLLIDILRVGYNGSAELTASGTSLKSDWGELGYWTNSVGSIILQQGASWETRKAVIGIVGEGDLRVDSGSQVLATEEMVLANDPGSKGHATVTGANSVITVNGDLGVGLCGEAYVRVENEGKLNSSGMGTYGDQIGATLGSQGTVEVDGLGSLWQTDKLIVGYSGQGLVQITNGGKIETTGNAYIGYTSRSYQSRVTLDGAASDGTPSTWQVSGDLFLAGDETGPSSASESRLTIDSGGLVEVTGTTTYWQAGGWIELHGGTLRTGELVKGCGIFDWTTGLVDLTNSGLVLDNNTPDSVFGYNLTIDAGKSLVLSNPLPSPWQDLIVGHTGVGLLVFQGGGMLSTAYGVQTTIGHAASSNGSVTVTGRGSAWNLSGPLKVGLRGHGTLNITDGGRVEHSDLLGSWYNYVGDEAGSFGEVLVDGVRSFWDVSVLVLGTYGKGHLTISNGGRVSSESVTMGSYPSATAQAVVTGTNSTWAIGNSMVLGGTDIVTGGPATLMIEDSAFVSVKGLLKVWPNSRISMGGYPNVGGTLYADRISLETGASFITNNGTLVRTNGLVGFGDHASFGGNLQLGYAEGITGAGRHIVGMGQTLDINGFFTIGLDAPGNLDIRDGGSVQSYRSFIAAMPGSNESSVTVQGAGSQWNILKGGPSGLYVGGDDTSAAAIGILRVVDGGGVNIDDRLVAWETATIHIDNGTILTDRLELTGGLLEGKGAVLTGELVNDGLVAPGLHDGSWTGTFVFSGGSYSQQSSGILHIDIAGLVPGDNYDVLEISGPASLAGQLETTFWFDGSFLPKAGDQFTFLTATGGVTGQFTVVGSLPTIQPGVAMYVKYDPDATSLVVTFNADFDLDFDIDETDLALWNDSFGAIGTATHAQGDANGDSNVDGSDFLIWQQQFGSYVPSVTGNKAVPEPPTAVLMMVIISWLISLNANRHASYPPTATTMSTPSHRCPSRVESYSGAYARCAHVWK